MRNSTVTAITLTALIPAFCPAPLPGQKDRERKTREKIHWSQFYGGADHNNYRRRRDRIQRPKVLWHVPDVYGQPTVTDKAAYCGGTMLRKVDLESGKVLAAIPAGKEGADTAWGGSPVLTGTAVIALRTDGSLQAWNPSLDRILWKLKLPSQGRGGWGWFPPAYTKGKLVLAAGPVLCVDAAKGKVLWKAEGLKGPVEMAPAVAGGRVFFATSTGTVHALDLDDGAQIWQKEMEARFGWSCPVVFKEHLFLADRGSPSRRGCLHAFHTRSGRLFWSQEFGATGCSTPGLGPGVLLAGFGKVVVAFDQKTGEPEPGKIYRTYFNPFGTPTLVGETLIFGNLDGFLYAFSYKGNRLLWRFTPSAEGEGVTRNEEAGVQVSGFVHLPDGRLLVATTRGLFALGSDRRKCSPGFTLHYTPPPEVVAGKVTDLVELEGGWTKYTLEPEKGTVLELFTDQENLRKWLEKSWRGSSRVEVTYREKEVEGERRKVITKVKPLR